jgi:phosphoribosylformylglycinamidine synthase
VGADPERIAILDNFCWGDCERAETLGALVRAAIACRDVAVALGTPFISGKDSLNNEFSYIDADGNRQSIAIPPTLLISALGQVDDVNHCVTMDLKQPGNLLYIVGLTDNELGGSHYALVRQLSGGRVPRVDVPRARATFAAVHGAIAGGLVRACHDLSEGGLAVAAAEMAFAGGLGARLDLAHLPTPDRANLDSAARLFSESNSRFLCEVEPADTEAFEQQMGDLPWARIGEVTDAGRLEIDSCIDADLDDLKEAWQRPLRW